MKMISECFDSALSLRCCFLQRFEPYFCNANTLFYFLSLLSISVGVSRTELTLCIKQYFLHHQLYPARKTNVVRLLISTILVEVVIWMNKPKELKCSTHRSSGNIFQRRSIMHQEMSTDTQWNCSGKNTKSYSESATQVTINCCFALTSIGSKPFILISMRIDKGS